jgi:amino acid adenylation domain-containing protein
VARQDSPARPALRPVARRPDPLPLSFAQQRLWFLAQLEGGSATYNIPLALRLRGEPDRAALDDALRDVVGRHESLRTVFPVGKHGPHQRVLPLDDVPLTMGRIAARGKDPATTLAELAGYVFDLGVEVPVRATLVEVGPADHVLVVVMHHIASDEWSNGPFLRDLATAYEARLAGAAPRWRQLPVQYADYTLWQRDLLGDGGAQVAYWKRALDGLPEQVSLPVDRPRPAVASHRGGRVGLRVDPDVHAKLVELASRSAATLFMVVQAATAAALARSGAGNDVPLGAPIAGRVDPALDDLVGFFVNTLVLRTDVGGDPSFRELLRRVRETDLAAWAHQDLPFERLVEELNPERSTSRHPLFQVMVTLAEGERGVPQLAGLQTGLAYEELQIAKFDLTVAFSEDGDGGLGVGLEYARELYEPETVRAFGERLVRLLGQVVERPDAPIGDLDLIGEQQRRRLVEPRNGDLSPRTARSLPEIVRGFALSRPEAAAIRVGERVVSYAELDERAGRLAGRLIAAGITPEDRVLLLQDRGVDVLVSMLAVLKAGGAYVPVDVRYPAERVRQTLRQAGANLVLADREVDYLDVPVLDAGDVGDTRAPELEIHPDQLAYVIFTSGSTGVPKGSANTHRNVADLVADAAFGDGIREGMMLQTSLAFDVSVLEIWGPLLQGGCVLVAPPGVLSPHAMGEFLAAAQPPEVFLTAGLFHVMAEENPAGFRGVRQVWSGGDVVSPEAVRQVMEHCPDTTVVNGYGPTEATVFAVTHPVRRAVDYPGALPIGTPLENTGIYVLDERMRLVPPGVTGELYIAGPALARGYLAQPALTAERFVANPYGPPGDRMYRTGDLSRWTLDGLVEFGGRADQQVKLRGFRVEPGEIETVLLRRPEVLHATMLVREDRPGDKRLVAYVVPAEGAICEPEGLRAAVAAVLPEFMVPSAFLVLDALPLTVNGKLDRAALPAPEFGAVPGGRSPRTHTEQVLCDLFADLLGVSSVTIDDNFFHLGGHSLLATRLVNRIRAALSADLTVADLFEHPVVARLADRIGRVEPVGVAPRPKLRPYRRTGVT